MAEFGLSYGTIEEFNFRMERFSETHEEIMRHNSEGKTWKLGHNMFSSWTEEERKRLWRSAGVVYFPLRLLVSMMMRVLSRRPIHSRCNRYD